MTPSKYAMSFMSALAATTVFSASSHAQEQGQRPASAFALEEVVVTAQKREEKAQSTPLSISVLSANDIQKRAIANTYDLIGDMAAVSGFESSGGRGATTLSLRGLTGGAPLNSSLSPAVAIYVDGVYIGKQRSSATDVADLQRIEVIKGPQGTLFGRNSTGGAVNMITQPPTGEFGFKLSAKVGNYDQREFRLSLDTPALGDVSAPLGQLSANFGYQKRERDGFYRNTVAGDPDFMDTDREAYRFAADWRLSDDTLFAYRYDGSRLDETNNLEKVVDLVPQNAAGTISRIDTMKGVLAAARGWALTPGTDPRITQRLIPSLEASIDAYTQAVQRGQGRVGWGQADHMPVTKADVDGHALTFTTNLGEVGFLGEIELKSITAYRKVSSSAYGDIEDFDSRLDANGVGVMNDTLLATFGQLYGGSSGFAFPLVDSVWDGVDTIGAFHAVLDDEDTYRQRSQELQLIGTTDRTEYVLGLYYFDEDYELGSGADRGNIYLAPLSGGGRETLNKAESTSEAVFGQVKWTPGVMADRFSVTAGLRYTKEEKDIYQFEGEQLTIFGINPERLFEGSKNFYNLSGALTFAYQFSDDVSAYLRYSTGYRSGGFNTGIFANPFGEETVEQYEIGMKSEWFERRMRLNASLWTYEWEDGQISQIEVTPDGRALSFIGNGGLADRWGGEIDLQALPMEDMQVSISYAYINGDYEEFPELCGTNLPQTCLKTVSRAKRSSSPGNSLSASVDYVFLRSGVGNLRGYLQANWQDASHENALWSGLLAGDPVIYKHQVMDERTVVNASLSLEDIAVGAGQMTVSLWGRNLTDDDYPLSALNLGALGVITEQYGDPRTYGLELIYQY
ncbi:MAG: TonB-dependent receptor [Spongiibacteraceae bacterium]|jgi:iron complex outermembrane receptor protein|nr:TonB-dependent receptor [Spongiibacteraceae bacterium]